MIDQQQQGTIQNAFQLTDLIWNYIRGGKSIDKMIANGITSAVCNYTDKEQLTAAFHSTGAKLFFLITDFESAAKGKQKLEEQQGRDQIDAAKAAGFTTFDIEF